MINLLMRIWKYYYTGPSIPAQRELYAIFNFVYPPLAYRYIISAYA